MDDATTRTYESFGYEWNRFDSINAEDEQFWRRYVADLDLADLNERTALDAGCGKARYSLFTARHVKTLVALDGSDAVEAAQRNLTDVPNATVVKADLRHAPFADATFGFVSCLGVLHHLADPRQGFRALTRVLAPQGILLLYLYSRPDTPGLRATGLNAAAALRKITTRLPYPPLRVLCAPLAAVLYATVVVPGHVGAQRHIKTLARLPLTAYRGRPLRSLWLDTFDRLSAPVEYRYIWRDIEPWFADEGLTVRAVRDEAGLFVVAQRPST